MASDTGSDDVKDQLNDASLDIMAKAIAAGTEGRIASASVMLLEVVAGELIRIRRAMEFMADQYRRMQ